MIASFFLFVKCSLPVVFRANPLLKGKKCHYGEADSGFFFSSLGFDEDERSNDLRWNFISHIRLLRQTAFFYLNLANITQVDITYGLLGVSLSIKTYPSPSTRTISLLSCPRVVNHDTRGKSQKHNEGLTLHLLVSIVLIDSYKQFVTRLKNYI